jgi:hypothetical protein
VEARGARAQHERDERAERGDAAPEAPRPAPRALARHKQLEAVALAHERRVKHHRGVDSCGLDGRPVMRLIEDDGVLDGRVVIMPARLVY